MYAVLRTLKWKPVTQHFKTHYMPISTVGVLQVYYSEGEYAIVNTKTSEYAKVPVFIANTLMGNNFGKERGPFIFKNGFDETEEAAYLIAMLRYSRLTATAEKKVDSIRQRYADWISYDIEVNELLRTHIGWL